MGRRVSQRGWRSVKEEFVRSPLMKAIFLRSSAFLVHAIIENG